MTRNPCMSMTSPAAACFSSHCNPYRHDSLLSYPASCPPALDPNANRCVLYATQKTRTHVVFCKPTPHREPPSATIRIVVFACRPRNCEPTERNNANRCVFYASPTSRTRRAQQCESLYLYFIFLLHVLVCVQYRLQLQIDANTCLRQ